VVFGLGGMASTSFRAHAWRVRNKIIGVDVNPGASAGREIGMTHFVNPKESERIWSLLVALTDGGSGLQFRMRRQRRSHAPGAGGCHRGWGVSVIIGVAGAGQGNQHPPFSW